MKRCYFVSGPDESEGGYAFVASSAQEARKTGWRRRDLGTDTFLEVRARWIRGVDVSEFELGDEIPLGRGIELGIYSGEI